MEGTDLKKLELKRIAVCNRYKNCNNKKTQKQTFLKKHLVKE